MEKQTKDRKILQDGGFRATKPRLLILSLLQKAKYPLSVKELRLKLASSGVNEVTCYRTLAAFKKAGIATQVDFQNGSAYYELRDSARDHHHIVCTECRAVEDFEGCEYEKLAEKALRGTSRFAAITAHSFEFFGVCRSCFKN